METIKEVIKIGNARIELKVLLPYGTMIEHCIKTVEGKERWGYISDPTLFADIYYNNNFAFTLTRKEFADHIKIDIYQSLNLLKEKTISFLNNNYKLCEDSNWHERAVVQRDSHLEFLPRIFKGV